MSSVPAAHLTSRIGTALEVEGAGTDNKNEVDVEEVDRHVSLAASRPHDVCDSH